MKMAYHSQYQTTHHDNKSQDTACSRCRADWRPAATIIRYLRIAYDALMQSEIWRPIDAINRDVVVRRKLKQNVTDDITLMTQREASVIS